MKTMIALAVVGIGCWVVMFLAGTDVWHSSGSPDFWRLSDSPYYDMRLFAYAFYAQFAALLAAIGFGAWNAIAAKRRGKTSV